MTEGNLSLKLAKTSDKPIYVIRGSGHRSPYSPPYGYAFAGKYTVMDYKVENGKSGFKVIRFRLSKVHE